MPLIVKGTDKNSRKINALDDVSLLKGVKFLWP